MQSDATHLADDMADRRSDSRRILCVDDDGPSRRSLAALISTLGYLAEQAATGEEALQMLGERRYTAVLTDWHMDGMDGPALIQAARLRKVATPFVLITGSHERPSTSGQAWASATRVLTKPVDQEALARLLAEMAGDP